MDQNDRLQLANLSTLSTNKKLNEVLQNREEFLFTLHSFRQSLDLNNSFQETDDSADILEGRDISVCTRIRPLLHYEKTAGYFETIIANQPMIHTFQPTFDFKKAVRPVTSSQKVDFAFGPEHTNEDVYKAAVVPLVDLGLRGGVSTLFAYGQTGSGKTFTISGILEPLARDLFERNRCDKIKAPSNTEDLNQKVVEQNAQDQRRNFFLPELKDTKIYISVFELLGNKGTDLLDKDDSPKSVDILENKFGKVEAKGTKEYEVNSAEELISLVNHGFQHRRTERTFKNDTSSRSHAVCKIRIESLVIREAEDGMIFIVDLAGSENASDAQFHDKELVSQTKLINKSLMALKECVRNRALAATNPDTFYHVPYRLSKLTLLLKDAFELESKRLAKTVVIANLSSSCADVAASLNTLKYVAPIKIGQTREKVIPNPKNPANWSNEKLREWVTKASKGKVDADRLCPHESGMQILRLPEIEFLKRVLADPANDWKEEVAKKFYISLWKKLIDARTTERKNKLKRNTTRIDYD